MSEETAVKDEELEETDVEKTATIEESDNDEKVIDDATAEMIFQEIKQGFRDWEHEGVKYTTRLPNSGEVNDSNWVYSKAFNRALLDGLPTNSQMEKLLVEREIWTDADESEVTKLREKVGSIEAILAKKEVKDRSKQVIKLVEELAEARMNLISKNSTYQEYMSQTVEAKADEAKTAFLISKCTALKDGNLVWESTEDFLADRNSGLVNQATYQYVTFSSGLASNYLEDLTEVKFMRAGLTDETAK